MLCCVVELLVRLKHVVRTSIHLENVVMAICSPMEVGRFGHDHFEVYFCYLQRCMPLSLRCIPEHQVATGTLTLLASDQLFHQKQAVL
jgi:hypothetical protein